LNGEGEAPAEPRRRCPGAASSQDAEPEARGLKPVVHVHVDVDDHERCDDSFKASKGTSTGKGMATGTGSG